ncbi:hypothetical protein [Cystobacter ferrugineus]|uniref:Uncharacterized protein n=1 Tax=Cystobacter ferrugineus TaxID=83449 RepID=A0A1L9BGA8_9BACT|nr:hypothetical protein [Cystobacter ferrugineus]OJH41302.1 hypothetical protein BON30_10540 [Cystobacter ferrugineus]
MAIDKAGGSKPQAPSRSSEPKPAQGLARPAAGAAPAAPARNQVKPQQPKGRDGFERGMTPAQQQQRLGSTPAVAPTQAPAAADRQVLEKLGLTAEDVQKAGPALPHLRKAAESVLQGHPEQALGHLRDAAFAAPEVATKALKGLAQNLPPGLGRSLLTDDRVARELITNAGLHDSFGKLMRNPADTGALRELLSNNSARDAVLGAVGNDPAVKGQLERIGLTPQDLVDAGAAAPKLLEAFEKIQQGDVKGGLESVQAAVQAAPQLAAKIGEKVVNALPQSVKAQFQKLGITEQQLRSAGPALPHLYEAADAASKGDWGKAFNGLREAAISAPDLTTQAMKGLAQQLPPQLGVVKSLLTNDGFLRQALTNRDLHAQVGKLFNEQTRMEGLRGLLNNDAARNATLSAIGNDPTVKGQLERIGLTPQDLVDAGAAAPKLLEAFEKIQQGDVKGGLESVQAAVQAAPGLAAKIGEKVVNALPQSVKAQFQKLGITEQQLRSAGPALPHLYEAADAASKGDWGKAFNGLREAAISAPDLTTQAMKGLAQQLPAQLGAAKSLLTDDAFLRQVVTNRDLHAQVGKLFNEQTRMEGLRGLLGNDAARNAALSAIGKDPGVQGMLAKAGLDPKDLVEAGAAAPHLFDAARSFADGKINEGIDALSKAAEAAPELLNKLGERLVSKLPEGLRNNITALGITPSELIQAGKGLPDLLKAGQALGQGDFQAALTNLRNAAGKIPPSIIEKAITTTAAKLPDNAFSGIARSLLTDKELVHQLVTNPELHASFNKMMSGDLVQGAREILGNATVRDAAANALAQNAGFMEKLKPFGIQNGADVAALGGAAFDVMEAGAQFAQGKPGEALRSLGKALGDIPPDLRGRMVGALADKLHVPAWAGDTLAAAASLLGNEQVGKALGDAFGALQRGDVGGFLSGIATTGKTIAQTAPEAAKAFLNSLSRIPGSIGRLFEDHELNAAMVDSGAVTNIFEAAEKLGRGDIGGALSEIAQTGTALLGQGEHFKIAGQELPFGSQGIENLTRMFGRFVDALPGELKERIATEAAKFGAKAGLRSVPLLGNIVNGVSAIGSAKDLVDAIKAEPKDALNIALAAGQLGLDVAGVFPGLNSITGPLQAILGTARVVKGASDLIGDINEFQRGLVGA